MFPVRYYPTRYYAARLFPPGSTGGPTIINVSLVDSVVPTDLVDTYSQLSRLISNNVSSTDIITGSLLLLFTINDSVSVSDQQDRIGVFSREITDTTTLSDLLDRTYTGQRSIIDSAGVSDERSSLNARSLSEVMDIIDSVVASRIISLNIQETVEGTDATEKIRELVAQLQDTGAASDDIATIRDLVQSIGEQVDVQDLIDAYFVTFTQSIIQDTVLVSDTVLAYLRFTSVPKIVSLDSSDESIPTASRTDLGTDVIRLTSRVVLQPVTISKEARPLTIPNADNEGTPNIVGKELNRD